MFTKFNWVMPPESAPYLSVAALAGLDTVFGGVRAGIEGRFQNDIFVSGFLLNTLLASRYSGRRWEVIWHEGIRSNVLNAVNDRTRSGNCAANVHATNAPQSCPTR